MTRSAETKRSLTPKESFLNAVLEGNLSEVNRLLELDSSLVTAVWGVGAKPLTALHIAARERKMDIVTALLDAGADVNAICDMAPDLAAKLHCATALHYAVDNGDRTMVETLLTRGADIRLVSNNQKLVITTLYIAVEKGNTEIIELLLANENADEAFINKANKEGRTPLHAAAQNGDVNAVIDLLDEIRERGVKEERKGEMVEVVEVVNAADKEGRTPLHLAASYENKDGAIEIMRVLINAGANDAAVDSKDVTPFQLLEFHHGGTAVEDLLNLLNPKDGKNDEIFMLDAAKRLDLEALKGFLSKGVNPNAAYNTDGSTALHCAIRSRGQGIEEVVDLLLSSGAEVNTTDLKVVILLLSSGAEVNTTDLDGNTALMIAAEKGNIGIINLLLGRRAEVNKANKGGWTPLHAAAQVGHIDVVRALLKAGADVYAVDRDQHWTPLHIAIMNGHANVAIALLAEGADINALDGQNQTPLYLAEQSQHQDFVGIFFNSERGAEVDAANKEGRTPLHAAAQNGDVNAVIDLLDEIRERGVKEERKGEMVEVLEVVNAADKEGRTPLHLAASYKNKDGAIEIMRVLINAGANDAAVDSKDGTPFGRTPFQLLESRHGRTAVEDLLNLLNPKDGKNDEISMLHAARKLDLEALKGFLSKGVNPNATYPDGRTALHCAIRNGGQATKEVVSLLLRKRTRVDKANNKQKTPLHEASIKGNVEVIELLLAKGAEVDAVDLEGRTPLHLAVIAGKEGVVKTLIRHGARVDAVDLEGRTPICYTESNDIANALLDALDRPSTTPSPEGRAIGKGMGRF